MRDWRAIVRERISRLGLEPTTEWDVIEEVAQHLDDLHGQAMAGGATEEEAYRAAVAELEDTYPLREVFRRKTQSATESLAVPGDAKRGNPAGDIWRDLRYAVRAMRKAPAFVFFVVAMLALGIGANTTVFTVINTLILNPLPVPDSSSVVAINGVKAGSHAKSDAPQGISYADFEDYQAGNTAFRSLAAYLTPHGVTWQTGNTSQSLFAEFVTSNYFSALELTPARGRFFLPEENDRSAAHAVAVLNYGTWQSRFGGAADVLGRTMRLNNVVFTVIGVAPPQFIGMNGIFGPDLWAPAAMAERLQPVEMKGVLTDRGKNIFQGVGRLKPGETEAQAQANLGTVAANLAREYPATNRGRAVTIRPVREILFASNNSSAGQILFASAGLLAVVGIVLLIACSNVVNLLLARAANRQQEMAVRLALGASRARLVRQLLTESVVLGLLSGAAGMFVAYTGLHFLFGMLPSAANFVTPKVDARVFAFALLISVATSLLFGMIPALKASRTGVAEALKEEARTAGRSQKKITLANALLVGQVAFSFLLLMTAALFLRSIGRAYVIDPGFETAHLAVFMTNPGQAGYGKPEIKAFYQNAAERVARIPDVEAVAWSSALPLWSRPASGLQIEGREKRAASEQLSTIVETVSPRLLTTAGVALMQGREFTASDREGSVPVAIVNEKLAREFWGAGEALGKRIQIPGEKEYRQIVGIARTANYTAWAEAPQFCVYVPLAQNESDAMTLYVRSRGNPDGVLRRVQEELRAAGPRLMVNVLTGKEIVEDGLFFARSGVMLLSIFGILALSLASIGLYGILAYSVSQRKREIGLRMALGAPAGSVRALVLRQGMSLVLGGVLIGFAGTLAVGRLLSGMLYGVSATDPLSIAEAVAILCAIALVACYLPARQASRVDPLVALREG